MNEYKHFRFEDFIQDKKFKDWVFNTDVELDYFWNSYIDTNPDQKGDIEKAVLFLKDIKDVKDMKGTGDGMGESRQNRLWARLQQSMDVVDNESPANEGSKVVSINPEYEAARKGLHDQRREYILKKSQSARRIRVAAVAVFLLALSVSFYFFNKNQGTGIPAPSPTVLTNSNPSGQRSNIFLPDGSTVILGAGSTISYQSEFVANERSIKLQGEAFFEVVKDSLRPFKVISNGVVTTALGTSFNVNSLGKDVEVSLVTGRVLVEISDNQSANKVLEPGEQAVYLEGSATLKTRSFDVRLTTSWKDGILIFKNSSHKAFFDRLERWYGVEFDFINQPSEKWDYSGEFSKENLENVLKGVGFAKDFDFLIKGKKVDITFK